MLLTHVQPATEQVTLQRLQGLKLRLRPLRASTGGCPQPPGASSMAPAAIGGDLMWSGGGGMSACSQSTSVRDGNCGSARIAS